MANGIRLGSPLQRINGYGVHNIKAQVRNKQITLEDYLKSKPWKKILFKEFNLKEEDNVINYETFFDNYQSYQATLKSLQSSSQSPVFDKSKNNYADQLTEKALIPKVRSQLVSDILDSLLFIFSDENASIFNDNIIIQELKDVVVKYQESNFGKFKLKTLTDFFKEPLTDPKITIDFYNTTIKLDNFILKIYNLLNSALVPNYGQTSTVFCNNNVNLSNYLKNGFIKNNQQINIKTDYFYDKANLNDVYRKHKEKELSGTSYRLNESFIKNSRGNESLIREFFLSAEIPSYPVIQIPKLRFNYLKSRVVEKLSKIISEEKKVNFLIIQKSVDAVCDSQSYLGINDREILVQFFCDLIVKGKHYPSWTVTRLFYVNFPSQSMVNPFLFKDSSVVIEPPNGFDKNYKDLKMYCSLFKSKINNGQIQNEPQKILYENILYTTNEKMSLDDTIKSLRRNPQSIDFFISSILQKLDGGEMFSSHSEDLDELSFLLEEFNLGNSPGTLEPRITILSNAFEYLFDHSNENQIKNHLFFLLSNLSIKSQSIAEIKPMSTVIAEMSFAYDESLTFNSLKKKIGNSLIQLYQNSKQDYVKDVIFQFVRRIADSDTFKANFESTKTQYQKIIIDYLNVESYSIKKPHFFSSPLKHLSSYYDQMNSMNESTLTESENTISAITFLDTILRYELDNDQDLTDDIEFQEGKTPESFKTAVHEFNKKLLLDLVTYDTNFQDLVHLNLFLSENLDGYKHIQVLSDFHKNSNEIKDDILKSINIALSEQNLHEDKTFAQQLIKLSQLSIKSLLDAYIVHSLFYHFFNGDFQMPQLNYGLQQELKSSGIESDGDFKKFRDYIISTIQYSVDDSQVFQDLKILKDGTLIEPLTNHELEKVPFALYLPILNQGNLIYIKKIINNDSNFYDLIHQAYTYSSFHIILTEDNKHLIQNFKTNIRSKEVNFNEFPGDKIQTIEEKICDNNQICHLFDDFLLVPIKSFELKDIDYSTLNKVMVPKTEQELVSSSELSHGDSQEKKALINDILNQKLLSVDEFEEKAALINHILNWKLGSSVNFYLENDNKIEPLVIGDSVILHRSVLNNLIRDKQQLKVDFILEEPTVSIEEQIIQSTLNLPGFIEISSAPIWITNDEIIISTKPINDDGCVEITLHDLLNEAIKEEYYKHPQFYMTIKNIRSALRVESNQLQRNHDETATNFDSDNHEFNHSNQIPKKDDIITNLQQINTVSNQTGNLDDSWGIISVENIHQFEMRLIGEFDVFIQNIQEGISEDQMTQFKTIVSNIILESMLSDDGNTFFEKMTNCVSKQDNLYKTANGEYYSEDLKKIFINLIFGSNLVNNDRINNSNFKTVILNLKYSDEERDNKKLMALLLDANALNELGITKDNMSYLSDYFYIIDQTESEDFVSSLILKEDKIIDYIVSIIEFVIS